MAYEGGILSLLPFFNRKYSAINEKIKLSRPFEILKALAPEVRVLNCIFEPVSPYDNYHKNNENYFFSGSFSSVGDRCGSTRPEVKNEHEEKWLGWLDSNQRSRDQNPLPCRLATPQ